MKNELEILDLINVIPTKEIARIYKISASTVRDIAAKHAVKIKKVCWAQYTDEEVISMLCAYKKINKRFPKRTKNGWKEPKFALHHTTLIRHFGSFENAKQAASHRCNILN